MGSETVTTFLGVDGGGTKTDFLLIDKSGRTLASHRAGSAYYLEIGVEALEVMVERGMRSTLAQAAVPANELTFACIGLPAYGEDSALLGRFDDIAASVIPRSRYRCVNDMVCAWAAALGGRDGINIVAGTGSIGYGEFQGRGARAGGWGELFSDEGSAYWLAREALTLFSRMSDGRAPRGALHGLVRGHFKLQSDLDLCAAVYGPPTMTRSALAALAPLLSQAALAGDPAAQTLLAAAAEHLASIVHAVRDQLGVPIKSALPVCYSGGLFQQDTLTSLLAAALKSDDRHYEFAPPLLAPCAGAALHAAKLAGLPLTAQAIAQLARAHGASAEDVP